MSSLNETPSAQRLHIAFFGVRNAGKSSVVNAVTGQELSIVSHTKGTTTDPVQKAMELLPLGPVVIIDTPGIDDEGELGEKRVKRTRKVLDTADIAVLVVDATLGMTPADEELLTIIHSKNLPYLVVYNKSDLLPSVPPPDTNSIWVSALRNQNIWELKEKLASLSKTLAAPKRMLADLVKPGDRVVLVCPIDESAPKGRLILPQQQAVREVLDAGALAVVTRDRELSQALALCQNKPDLVITDSQAFGTVAPIVPEDVSLTSFSILMANYKGFLKTAVEGAAAFKQLKDGDHILLAEGCTHHRQCNDIGAVKIPRWIRSYTGKNVTISHCSGRDFPEDLSPYALVIHCGGCMLTERDVQQRMYSSQSQGVPFTNYGTTIALITGTLERSLRILPQIHDLLTRQ